MENLDTLIPIHPDRKRIYQKFYDLISSHIKNGKFNNSINYNNEDIKKMTINIERGIFNQAIYSKTL